MTMICDDHWMNEQEDSCSGLNNISLLNDSTVISVLFPCISLDLQKKKITEILQWKHTFISVYPLSSLLSVSVGLRTGLWVNPVTFPADTFDLTDGASGEPAPPHPVESLAGTQNFINPVASCLVPAA